MRIYDEMRLVAYVIECLRPQRTIRTGCKDLSILATLEVGQHLIHHARMVAPALDVVFKTNALLGVAHQVLVDRR